MKFPLQSWKPLLVILLCLPQIAHSAPLIDSDFAKAASPVNQTDDAGKSIIGVLPKGWGDRSGYQKGVQIRYELAETDGRKGLRVTKIKGGEVQLIHQLPQDLLPNAIYRLTVSGRNPDQMGIKFGVRDNSAPWNMYWSKSPGWGNEWQTWTADFTLPAKHNEYGFYLFASGSGIFDLGRVTLTQRVLADLIAEAKQKFPDGGPKNLMRHTRFPLGLQSGWSLESKQSLGTDVLIEAAAKSDGPSSQPGLHLQSNGRSITLWSSPFDVARIGDKHTASFYVRGTGTGKLQVRADYHQTLVSQEFSVAPAEGWKRISASFDPRIGANVRALRWEFKGDATFDALQVEPGETAGAYASQLPLEIALAPRKGDASDVRIHFADEPAVVDYRVSGVVPAGGRLSARTVDVYGNSQPSTLPLPRIEGAIAAAHSGTIGYNRFPNAPLGAFRIEARVEDASGAALSPWNELVMTRIRRPRYWGKDAPNSPFGIHMAPLRQDILLAKAAGINWTRLHDAGGELINWIVVEPEKGKFNWQDAGIQRFRDANIKILGVLSTTPKWASIGQQGNAGYFDKYFLPADINDWKNYVRLATSRYKGTIDDWDVWNEPWGGGYLNIARDPSKAGKAAFVKPADQPGAYLELQRAAVAVAKETVPDAPILLETTFGDWTKRALDEEKTSGRAGDIMAFHSYPGALLGWPKDNVAGSVTNKFAALKTSIDPNRKVWMTEGSPVNDRLFSGIYNHTLPYKSEEDVVDTSNRVARFMLTLLGNGAHRMFLYSQGKTAHFGKETLRWAVNVMEDGYPHPSVAAHSAFAYLIEDTKHVKNLEVAPGVYAYLFEGDGRAVAVVSSEPNHGKYTLPGGDGVETFDLFGNQIAAKSEMKLNLTYLVSKNGVAGLEKLLGGKAVP